MGLEIVFQKLKTWNRNGRIAAAFLMGLTISFVNVMPYLRISRALGYPVQLFEGYILIGNNLHYYNGIFLGSLILMADAPFSTAQQPYEMVRTGKKGWVAGHILYVISGIILYYAAIFAETLVLSVFICGISGLNQYSNVFRILAEGRIPDVASGLYFPYPNFLNDAPPYQAVPAAGINYYGVGSAGSSILLFGVLIALISGGILCYSRKIEV